MGASKLGGSDADWLGTFAEAVEEDLRQRWAAAFLFFFGFGRKEFALASHVGGGEL